MENHHNLQRRDVEESSRNNNKWLLLSISCIALAIGGAFVTFYIDPEMGINFSLNIVTEVIGIVATVIFVQSYIDMTNQKELQHTTKMLEDNMNELKAMCSSQKEAEPQGKNRKRRYKSTNFSGKKRT